MTEDCSGGKKKIKIFPLQEFVNPSSKVEMEITKFHPLLISKRHHLNGKASLCSHKARLDWMLCCHCRGGSAGDRQSAEHLKERAQQAAASLNQVTRACVALTISPQRPPSLFPSPEVLDPSHFLVQLPNACW